jgi:hypothetical protein
MKYLCLAYGDRQKMSKLTKEEFAALRAQIDVHDVELRGSGRLVSSRSLEWDAVSIRPRGGKIVVTDGPFLETKEQVGGLVVIEARDLNDAVRVASLHPAAHEGGDIGWGLEIHPIENTVQVDPRSAVPAGTKDYLLLAYGQREPFERQSPEQLAKMGSTCEAHDAEMRAAGHVIEGTSLSWDVMSIRPTKGKVVTTDGPFLETKELVGGLVVFAARDMKDAVRIASLHPAARYGEELGWGVELRPIAAGCHQ